MSKESAKNHSPNPRSSAAAPRAMAFGRNYFYCMGGTSVSHFRDEHIGSLTRYTWDREPWNKHNKASNNNNEAEDSVEQVACSAQATLFLTKSGKIYQTGTIHGRMYKTPCPINIPLPLKCVQISAGRHFCLGRMEGGLAVVSWGAGHFGQLAVGNSREEDQQQYTFTSTPVVVERLLPHMVGSPCKSVAAGDWHALALTESGRVWAWGSNRSFQCGRKPSIKSTHAPTLTVPFPVPMEEQVVQISAGKSHSAAIVQGGQVFCWGASHHGQCNVVRRSGVVPPRKVEGLDDLVITQVACGSNHTMVLTSGGRVFSFGGGSEGELGLGPIVSAQTKPRQVGDLDFVAIAAGQEWKNQQRSLESMEEPGAIGLAMQPTIVKIFAGVSYSAAISSSGHVYTWGSNDGGQAGIPTPKHLPLKDNLNPGIPTKTSTVRELHCYTFDSRHNLLLPVRVDAARSMFVNDVAGGPNHMWLIGNERTTEQQEMVVGQTLYEMQEEVRIRKLHRAKHGLLAKIQGDNDDGWTEGTMTQTENEDTTQEDCNMPNYQHEMSVSGFSEASEADTSRACSSTTATPMSGRRQQSPCITEGVVHTDASVSPFTPMHDSVLPSPKTTRRRFSLPKVLSRLSFGNSKRSDEQPTQQQSRQSGGSNAFRRRSSKRNSL